MGSCNASAPASKKPPAVAIENVSEEDFAALSNVLDAVEAERRYGTFAVDMQLLPTGAHFRVHGRPQLPRELVAALHALTASRGASADSDDFTFAVTDYRAVVKTIVPQFARSSSVVEIPAVLRAVVVRVAAHAENEALGVSETLVAGAVGRGFWEQIFSFQREGVLKAIRRGGRVLLADSMGLGKTISALAIAEYFRVAMSDYGDLAVSPVLILCPSTLRDAWVDAVSKWLPNVPSTAVHCLSSSKDAKRLLKAQAKGKRDLWDLQLDVQFVICSYDLLPRLLSDLNGVAPDEASAAGGGTAPTSAGSDRGMSTAPAIVYEPTVVPSELSMFGAVIADECHTLKNSNTARARACVPVLLAAKYRILVSGTPVTSHPGELFTQLQALLGEGPGEPPFLPPAMFRNRYCNGANFRELNALLNMVMIRRSKSEAGVILPPKVRSHSYVELTDDRLTRFDKMLADRKTLRKEVAEARSASDSAILRTRLGALNRALFSTTAQAKIAGVVTRLRQLMLGQGNEGRKVLLFAYHQAVLDAVQDFCGRERLRYIRLDGSVPSSARGALVNLFQSDDSKIRVAILSIQTASTGLTLTKANHVVFAELDWVPSNLTQAEDRAHRIGQQAVVYVEYIVAPGTLDECMWPCVRRKLGMTGKLVDGVGDNHIRLDPDVDGATIQQSDVSLQATVLAAADGITWNQSLPSQSQPVGLAQETDDSQAVLAVQSPQISALKRPKLCQPTQTPSL